MPRASCGQEADASEHPLGQRRGSWARCRGRLPEARRHGWQSRDSNLGLHSALVFVHLLEQGNGIGGWGMSGLGGARVRGLGCPVETLAEEGQMLRDPIRGRRHRTLLSFFQRPHVEASDQLTAPSRAPRAESGTWLQGSDDFLFFA